MNGLNHQTLPVVAVDCELVSFEFSTFLGDVRKVPPNLINRRPERAIRRRQESQMSIRDDWEHHWLENIQAAQQIGHAAGWKDKIGLYIVSRFDAASLILAAWPLLLDQFA